MKRISVRRVASVIVTAMAMTLVFATLGWAMMPQWNTRPYTKHIVIASADTTITPAHANIPHEGRYRTRETRLSIKTGDGVVHVPAGEIADKGKICVATVKGDIHDIGKNIVKMLLDNYGYTVFDLGRDVDPQEVLKTVQERDIKLVGLSALMTTTVVAMEETIKLLHAEVPGVKVIVGGAVLTPEYAKQIGADYYAKDAAESARIAEEVFGQ